MTARPQALSRAHQAFAKFAIVEVSALYYMHVSEKESNNRMAFPSMSIISKVSHFNQFLHRKRDPDKSFSPEI